MAVLLHAIQVTSNSLFSLSFSFLLFPEIQMYGVAMYIIYPNAPIVLQDNWFEWVIVV